MDRCGSDVVTQAIAAAASGRSLCVAGAVNNAMVIASKFTPRALSTYDQQHAVAPVIRDKPDK